MGNEGAGIGEESASVELDGAEEMLEGFALGAAADVVAQGFEFRLGDWALEFHVELEALLAERVSEEVLRIQPRILDAMPSEIACCGLEHFENGLH